jgi:bacteriophage CI repressor helix-turn-helix domain
MDLGSKILELRKKQQLSQEKLGEKVGVTRQTISNWELNETLPDTKQLIALSQALLISIDELVGNNTQNLLEQKVEKVEEKITTNNNLTKLIIALITLVALLLIIFVSAV